MRKIFTYCFFILFNILAFSQSGTITYKNRVTPPDKLEALKEKDPKKYRQYSMFINKMSEAEKQAVYTLIFNSKKALFTTEKSMDKGNQALKMPKEERVYFYDLLNHQRIYQTESSGKYFRVKEAPIKWEILKENKVIKGYKCQKAVATQLFYSYDREGNLKTKKQPIECWFTAQIPVPYGPENYGGLPGLILSLSSQGNNYSVTNISLEEGKKQINTPKKGEQIGEKAFAEKMYKMYAGFLGN